MDRKEASNVENRPQAAKLRAALLVGTIAAVLAALYAFGSTKPGVTPTAPYSATAELPEREIAPGVLFHEVHLAGGHDARTLWIYTPRNASSTHLPCVFIGPSGTTGFYGKRLFENDRKEHVPYVKRGFAVMAYSVDGAFDDFYSDQIENGIVQFRASHCGVDNSHAAIDYALQHIPNVDPARLYAVGHSSGGTMALMTTEHDSRIAGCVAYAPACDITRRIDAGTLAELSKGVAGLPEFLVTCSPITYSARLTCPVFLFHADDDMTVTSADVTGLMDKARQTNRNVTFMHVAAGGHYDSMLQAGIPAGIKWLEALDLKLRRRESRETALRSSSWNRQDEP